MSLDRSAPQLGRLVANLHLGDVAHQDGDTVDAFHHTLGNGVDIGRSHGTAYDVFVAIFIEDAAVGIAVHLAGSGQYLVERHPVLFHARQVE